MEIHDELNATIISARLELQQILTLTAKMPPTVEVEKVKKGVLSIIGLTLNLYQRGRAIVAGPKPATQDPLNSVRQDHHSGVYEN